jgi:sulfatase maturation enzyme AslB (radical SAM superfamily)
MTRDGGTRINFNNNIQTKSPIDYFHNDMAVFRTQLLDGKSPDACQDCRVMEQHNKVSGRQRQLLKVGVAPEYFEKGLLGSPLRKDFDYSYNNQGRTDRMISDWQIDLGNYCNGACVFCGPESSSTLATEFKKLGIIDSLPPAAWCDDPVLLNKFIDALVKSPQLHYLHFIGGETVITPGFKKILSALVDNGLADQTTIGFTTNLNVWSDSVVDMLIKFKHVNLGMSIETLTPVNDYVRYPCQFERTQQLLNRWVALAKQQEWLVQLRITPTCLTVHELHTVYDYAWTNQLAVESCNFLTHPEFLRISVLPDKHRQQAVENLQNWITSRNSSGTTQVINTRNPNFAEQQVVQDAQSYLDYLISTEDESHRLPDLIQYLKLLESNRKNSIIDYLPQYENLFRSAGY